LLAAADQPKIQALFACEAVSTQMPFVVVLVPGAQATQLAFGSGLQLTKQPTAADVMIVTQPALPTYLLQLNFAKCAGVDKKAMLQFKEALCHVAAQASSFLL
jgi:hypothetical protein